MEKITSKEEKIMELFWEHEKLFIREILELIPNPKPHFNTISTVVRSLEEKGYLYHKAYGNSHRYYTNISKEEFKSSSIRSVVSKYFNNSIFSMVSTLVSNKELSADELKELKDLVKKAEKAEKAEKAD
ncbi:MAG: BlaI/MecI/CopY family transcriptional regulator [Rikenellaceae bacterium]